jgi:hypothetical protein
MYGTGTWYPGAWHYFRISKFKEEIPQLWSNRVEDFLNDHSTSPNYFSSFYGL